MNEKFTPAPWIYQDGDNFEKEAVITTEGRLDNCIVPICELDVYFDGGLGVEQAANAALIAAAPEMYAMLKQVAELVNTDGMSAIQWIMDNANDVSGLLAKARGDV